MKRSLKKNFILNLIVQILNVIVPLITAPYLARVLHEEGNGIYSYSYSIITYFILLANLGINIYGQREIARCRNDQDSLNRTFTELVVLKIITTSFSTLVLFTITNTIGWGNDYSIIIQILGVQVLGSILDINYLYQGVEDFKSIAIRQIIFKVISVLCIFIFVKKESDVWIYALCISLSIVGANFLMWPRAFLITKFVKIKFKNIFKHFVPALLIFLPTLAITVYSVFDKTMIGILSSNPKYDNGCYEQAYKINSVALVFVTVISPILIPRNSHDYSIGDYDSFNYHINFAIKYVFLISLPMIFGFFVLSDNLSSWFLGDGFDTVALMLRIMSVRFLFSGLTVVFSEQIFIAIGKEKLTLIATIFGAIFNLVLNYFFIKLWGAVGASITTAISEFVVMIVLLFFSLKLGFINIKNLVVFIWRYLLSSIIMFAVIFCLQKFVFGYTIASFFVIMLVGILVYSITLLILHDMFFISLIKKFFMIVLRKTGKSEELH